MHLVIFYAKYFQLYIEGMQQLSSILSTDDFNQFIEGGYFTIRRTHNWTGVWSDMTIEHNAQYEKR